MVGAEPDTESVPCCNGISLVSTHASPSATINNHCHQFIAYVLLLISHVLVSSELLLLFSKRAVETKKRDQVTTARKATSKDAKQLILI